MKNKSTLNIAIIHDIFAPIGGSENVVEELANMFPEADIYTTWLDKKKFIYNPLNKRIKTIISPLNPLLLFKNKNYIKVILQSYWERLDLSSYDIVFTSSHSFSSKSVLTSPKTLHICYCHTPPKYLYTEYSESNIRGSKTILPHIMLTYLRTLDYIAGQRPDIMIANSRMVQQRILKYYRRNSTVIYPPVEIPKTFHTYNKKNYYIFIGRLTKAKGLAMAINACNILKRKFIIIGDGDEKENLQKIAGPTIQFMGAVYDESKNDILCHSSGFIFPGIDEDFGIAPVEAMGWGTPVIAFKSGAMTETVIDGKTGVFFNTYSTESLIETIRKFEHMRFSQKVCYNQAKKFSTEVFRKNILSVVKNNV